MGVKDQPKTDLRGILTPFPQMLGITPTATSQAGPKVGGATPSQATALQLVGSGTLDAAPTADWQVATERAGSVDTARVRWRYVGDTAYRSWDPPVAISDWEFIDRTNTASRYTKPHIVRRNNGAVACSVVYDVSSVKVAKQGPVGKWTFSDAIDAGGAACACLCPLPSGRLLLFYSYYVSASLTQIRMATSDDDGATWTVASTDCLSVSLGSVSSNFARIRAVYLNGLISVLLWKQEAGVADTIYQYVSSDQGATLDLVETFSTANKACPDMAVRRGEIVVATIEYNSALTNSDYVPYIRKIGSASQPLSSVSAVVAQADAAGATTEWGSFAAGAFTDAECALLADDDGDLWLYGSDFDAAATREIAIRHSSDGGETWEQNGASGSPNPLGVVLFWSNDNEVALTDFSVCPERGRAIFAHRFDPGGAGVPSRNDSLCAAYLGGWTTVGAAEDESLSRRAGVSGWDVVWIPLEEPDLPTTPLWTLVTVGAPTATLSGTGLTITTAGLETNYYYRTVTLTAPIADGLSAEFDFVPTSGSTYNALQISDGANDYAIRLGVSSTTIVLRDMEAAADLVTVGSLSLSNGVVIKVALDKPSGTWAGNNGRVRVWYRARSDYTVIGPAADREWTALGAGAYTGLTAGVQITSRVDWGRMVIGAATATYRRVAFAEGLYTSGNIAGSVSGTTRGRVLQSSLSPLHLVEGARVHGVGGPTVVGDTWTVARAYDYGVENLDPSRSPSPRRAWRSTNDSIDQDITWSGLDIGWRPGDLLGIYMDGVNFETANLYRDTGAVNLVATLDFAKDLDLDFDRVRDQLIPKTGGASAGFHFWENALAGSHIDLTGSDIRLIARNHAGAWLASGAPATYPSARIILDSYDVADAATGTATLRMKSGLFVTEAMTSTDVLMLRIAAQATTEDYFTIGVCIIGRMRLLRQWSFGTIYGWEPLADLYTSPNGARIGRRRGPVRRARDIQWTDAINRSGTHTKGSSPNWVTLGYTSADAQYAPADTPLTLPGLLTEVGGSALPIVLAPAIQQPSATIAAATPITILDPEGSFYGRIVSESVRVENVIGHEMQDPGESVRIGVVRVEEEL